MMRLYKIRRKLYNRHISIPINWNFVNEQAHQNTTVKYLPRNAIPTIQFFYGQECQELNNTIRAHLREVQNLCDPLDFIDLYQKQGEREQTKYKMLKILPHLNLRAQQAKAREKKGKPPRNKTTN